MSDGAPILACQNVSIRYLTGDFKAIGLKEWVTRHLARNYRVVEFWADRNVSFTLEKGDMLGIVGTNGAGKSTLLKAVSGIMEPTEGQVVRRGRIAALLELASGFDGDLTVRENAYLRGAMLGYTRAFMDETYEQVVAFAELKDFEDRPFKQLSSGMKSRLAFSIASFLRPEILILDEVLSVGDGAFRAKSEAKMREIIQGGATTILVSHALGQVRAMCNKVLWLHRGRQVVFTDDVKGACDSYERFLKSRGADPVYVPSATGPQSRPQPPPRPAAAAAAAKAAPPRPAFVLRSAARTEHPRVSVVIPARNAEKLVDGCLTSVFGQRDFAEVEAICVDDGSTDGTAEILRGWAAREPRLKVVSQPCRGPGVARNVGLAAARGDYVAFLNADDRFASDTVLRRACETASGAALDVLLADGGSIAVDGILTDHQYLFPARAPKNPAFRPEEAGAALFGLTTAAPLAKLFRREWVVGQRLAFPPLMRSEDFPFVQLALATARRIGVFRESLAYHRCSANGSLWEASKDESPGTFLEAEDVFYSELASRGLLDRFLEPARSASVRRCAYNLLRVRLFASYLAIARAVLEKADGRYRVDPPPMEVAAPVLDVVRKVLAAGGSVEGLAQAFADTRSVSACGELAAECRRLRQRLEKKASVR